MNILWVGPFDAWARFTECALAAGHSVELHATAGLDASVERCDLVVIDTVWRDNAQAHHARRLARRLGRSFAQIDGCSEHAIRNVIDSLRTVYSARECEQSRRVGAA
jgi:hypothetical protein